MKGIVYTVLYIIYTLTQLDVCLGILPSVFHASYDVGNISASVPIPTRIRCGNAGLGSWFSAVEITSNHSCIAYRADEMGSIPPDAEVLYKIGDVQTFTPSYVLGANYKIGPTCPHHVRCGSTLAVEVDVFESSTGVTLFLHEGISFSQLSDTSLHQPFYVTARRSYGVLVATKYVPGSGWGPSMNYVWNPPSTVRIRFQVHLQPTEVELKITSHEGVSTYMYQQPIDCDRVNWVLIGSNNVAMPVHKFFYDSP